MAEENAATSPAHTPGTRKGEEVQSKDGTEPGRQETGTGEGNRPAGTRTARDSTAINPDEAEAQDPSSPKMPPA